MKSSSHSLHIESKIPSLQHADRRQAFLLRLYLADFNWNKNSRYWRYPKLHRYWVKVLGTKNLVFQISIALDPKPWSWMTFSCRFTLQKLLLELFFKPVRFCLDTGSPLTPLPIRNGYNVWGKLSDWRSISTSTGAEPINLITCGAHGWTHQV